MLNQLDCCLGLMDQLPLFSLHIIHVLFVAESVIFELLIIIQVASGRNLMLIFQERSFDFHSSYIQDSTCCLDLEDDSYHSNHLAFLRPSSFPIEFIVFINIPDKSLFSPESQLELDQVPTIASLKA